jgi:hypothetical protein
MPAPWRSLPSDVKPAAGLDRAAMFMPIETGFEVVKAYPR